KGLNDKMTKNRGSLLNLQVKKKKIEKENYEKLINESKQAIDDMSKKIDELKAKIEAKKIEMNTINAEIEKQSEEGQIKLNKEVEQLKIDIATNETKTENHKAEVKKIEERKKQLEESAKEVQAKLDSLLDEKNTLDKDIAEKKKEISLIDKKIEDFKKKHSLENLGEIEKQVEAIDKESDIKQVALNKLREEQQNLFREKDKLELQIQGLDEKIVKIEEVEKENKDQVTKLKRKKEEFKKATLELNKLLNEDSSLAAQLNNAKSKSIRAEEEYSKLRIKNASVRESLAGSEAVKRILDERTKFGGAVYGLISEIGQVESKYAVALEVAAGPKLKSIVVEDDGTAARCIKYLKEKKLGTATFLPLNKIRGVKKDDAQKYAKSKGVLGFASDFIEHDPKFKEVFSYVFGNTLIVENIDVAREIGIGNAKMVTLDGDMAETSGAMHGGYRQKKEKGLSFQEKDLVTDMKNYEKQIADYSAVIAKVDEKRTDNEKEITKLREFKAGMEGEIISMERSLHLESGDSDVSKKQKDLSKDSMKKIDKDIDAMQEKISELTRELAQMKIKRSELRTQMSDLRSPTILAEINAFEQKRTELRERFLKSESAHKNNKEHIENIYGPEKEKIDALIKNLDKEKENFKKDVIRMKKEIEQAQIDLKDKEKKAKKFFDQFKKLFDQKNELNEDIHKLDKNIFIKEEDKRKNEQKINNAQLSYSETLGQLQAMEEELKKYEGIELDENKSEESLKRELNNFERMIENMGNVNMRALEVYETVEKEYNSLMDKKNKLREEKEDVLVMMNEIESKKKDLFMRHYNTVNETFKKFFSELSTKGDAFLELENPEDPFQEGVMIKVRITGNKFLDIRSLSGGEKTMTALAFIFAIQEYDPASFYVMDEVDAALDKNNSLKLANMIRKYSEKAQYVVISHNDHLLTEADILYGVSMNEHAISKVVSLKI
ncbi:MAG: hypothetical protein Q8O89_08200, partial [Nanoarchaeota archaeon]|nr:hypothetical protein [Nanoarchaeota archaeon]